MRKILTAALIALSSFITILVGQAQEHPVLLYTGIIIGGFLVLALAIYLIKFVAKTIGGTFTSFFSLLALGSIVFVLVWHGIASPVIGYISGILIGISISMSVLRWLGKKAQKSMVMGEVFSFMTSYQLKAYLARESVIAKEDKDLENNDKKNIIVVLKEVGFTKKEASEAAEHAITQAPLEASLDDKVKLALSFIGRQN